MKSKTVTFYMNCGIEHIFTMKSDSSFLKMIEDGSIFERKIVKVGTNSPSEQTQIVVSYINSIFVNDQA